MRGAFEHYAEGLIGHARRRQRHAARAMSRAPSPDSAAAAAQRAEDATDPPTECVICFETMLARPHLPDDGGTVSVTACGHYFHTACLDALRVRTPAAECPLCRGAIVAPAPSAAAPTPTPTPTPTPIASAFDNIARAIAAASSAPSAARADADASAGASSVYPRAGADADADAGKASRAVVDRPQYAHLAQIAAAHATSAGPPMRVVAAAPPPPQQHPYIEQDVCMDDLCERAYSDAELALARLAWADACRIGLRRDHFDTWLAPERAPVLFAGASWAGMRELGFTLGDAVAGRLSAHALGRLGATAATLRASGELTHDVFLALPFSVSDWVRELRLTRADLVALEMRAADYQRLDADPAREWTSTLMARELHFSRAELVALRLIPNYDHVTLVV